ncbi:hypothetical protein TYRP_003581 [Tyrophagus putrescentiae]|nr:hypothetical protein TYRP_003581 [Tyrophagus putrescentiae]
MAAEQCVEKKKGPLADDLVHQLIHRTTGVDLNWKHFQNEKELLTFFEAAAKVIAPFKYDGILPNIWASMKSVRPLLNLLRTYFRPTFGLLCKGNGLANFVGGIPAAILLMSVTKMLYAVGQFLQNEAVLKKLTERLGRLEKQIYRLRKITAELGCLVLEYAEEESAANEVYTPLFNRIEALFGEAKGILYGDDLRGQLFSLRIDLEDARQKMEEENVKLRAAAIGSGVGFLLLSLFGKPNWSLAAMAVAAGTAAVVFDHLTANQLWNVEQALAKLDRYEEELWQTTERIKQLELEHRKVVESKKKKLEEFYDCETGPF